MSSGRNEAELFYKRKLDSWKSRSSRILYKAQSLNRTQDRKLVSELDILERNRDIGIRRAHEDIWKVTSKDCPVPRLPKSSDLPSYLAGSKPATTTLPTPAELASLLPRKIIRKKPNSTKQRYKVIPRKRLSLMNTTDIQVFHYRRMLEKQEETKTLVAGFFTSTLEKGGDAEKPPNADNSNADTTLVKPPSKPMPKLSLGSKWAVARNNLKDIREQNEGEESTDEVKDINNNQPTVSEVNHEASVSPNRLSTPNGRHSRISSANSRIDDNTKSESMSTSPSASNQLTVPPRRHIRPQSSPLGTTPAARTVLKKPRPSTSTGVSEQMLKSGNNKVLKTNYLDIYRKQMLEHKQRMSASGNLSEGARRRRSSITTPISTDERLQLTGQYNKSVGHSPGTPSKNTLNATMSSTLSGRRSPGSSACWSTPPSRDSNNNTLNVTMSSTLSGRSSPINGTPVQSTSPAGASDPSNRGIRQPGSATPEKRQSTLMKDTAASSRHKTRRLLMRTGSGVLVSNKLYKEVKEMRSFREYKKERLNVNKSGGTDHVPQFDIVDVDDEDGDLFDKMRHCRYIRWGDDVDVQKMNEDEPLRNQLSAMRLDISGDANRK